MIDVHELMIGNWVEKIDDWGNSLGFDTVRAREFLAIHDKPERVKPIPLTEDILIRCGFVKRHGIYEFGDWVYHVKSNVIQYTAWDAEHESKVTELHSLQNLIFALTMRKITLK